MSKKIPIFLFVFLAFSSLGICAGSLTGHWEGSIHLPGMELNVLLDFTQESDGNWKGTIDIPAQAAKGLTLSNISVQNSNTEFEIESVPGKPTFSGNISPDGEKITGNFTQSGQTFQFELNRKAATAVAAHSAKSNEEILASIRALVKSEMEQWHVPGLGLAIIKDGKVWITEGFGSRDGKQAVTADTLFAIGSSTKAFTATLVGMVVDEGKLKWDITLQNEGCS